MALSQQLLELYIGLLSILLFKTVILTKSQEELHQQILFEQNILVTDGAPFYSYRGDHSIAARRNLLWDLQSKTPVAFRHKHGEEISLADWQTLYGHDRGSILADPMLKDPANGDFTLSERSPAYDLGFSPLPDAVAKR